MVFAPNLVDALRERFHVTRVAETTYLDRAAIPLISAIVPDSDDNVSIYNGRGLTRDEALICALMETAERQTAVACAIPSQTATARNSTDLDLLACGLRTEYADFPMPFVEALDLVSERFIRVPQALVQMPWRGVPAFPTTHTNGLAAGSTWTEASLSALLELVERHLWALTHARAFLRPRRFLREAFGDDVPFDDDPVFEIPLPCGDARVDGLHAKIGRAGLRLRLVAMTEAGLPVGMLATVHERDGETERVHIGCGCSWSPPVAAVRAITEAMQARVCDTHATRENILRPGDPAGPFLDHTRRRTALPHGRWYFNGPTVPRPLDRFADASGPDPATELRRLVLVLSNFCERVAIVDLSPPDRAFAVVRAIVPELETMLVDGRIGAIARRIIEEA